MTRRLHYFEDLQPGQQFETDTCTVTKGDIVRFAREFDGSQFISTTKQRARRFLAGLSRAGGIPRP